MHAKIALPLAVVAATLALPAATLAQTTPQIVVNAVCAASSDDVPITGSGFTPNSSIEIDGGGASGFATADATGAWTSTVSMPFVSSLVPKALTIKATDSGTPALSATAPISVVKEFLATNADQALDGKPSGKAQWQFAGFVPGENIYGHFRFHKKTIANYRYGKASGVCGTLSVRARRLPAKSRPGTWTLQFDQVARYNRFTKPRRVLTFSIFRRFF